MALANYANENPWQMLACSILVTTLIAGAVFLTLGACGIGMGLLCASAVLGIGAALMAGSSIGLSFLRLWDELEEKNHRDKASLVI